MNIERFALISVLVAILAASGCGRPEPVEQMWLTMGTFASVTLRGDNAEYLDDYVSETAGCFSNLNASLSVYLPDSEISHLNESMGMMHVSLQTFQMLRETVRYCEITGGAFDPTLAPLIQAWGFSGGEQPKALPPGEAIEAALQKTGYQHIRLSEQSAGFDQPGMSIDLGGIAKGFAVDQAYDALAESRPANALINLGGNIRCLGAATRKRPWRIGVRHPFDGSLMLGSLTLDDGLSVATSGNYERFVTIDGERYAHIIDPRSGYPVQGMAGVTALSSTGTEADAVSTALFVVGLEGASALLARLPNSHALLVPDRTPMEIWVSPGFHKRFTPFPQYAESVRLLPAAK